VMGSLGKIRVEHYRRRDADKLTVRQGTLRYVDAELIDVWRVQYEHGLGPVACRVELKVGRRVDGERDRGRRNPAQNAGDGSIAVGEAGNRCWSRRSRDVGEAA